MTTEAEERVNQEQESAAMLAGFDSVRNPGAEHEEASPPADAETNAVDENDQADEGDKPEE